jgi:hypothetical protein
MAGLGGAAVSGRGRGAGRLEAARLSAPRTGGRGGGAGRRRGRGAVAVAGAAGRWAAPEVEGGPDRWAPPVSGAWEERGS